MTGKVILETKGNLYLRDFSLTQANEIGNIDFYVAAALKRPTQVFLVITDPATNLYDIIELHQAVNNLGNPVFKVPVGQAIRIEKAHAIIKLLVVDNESGTCIFSDPAELYLTTENYKIARETAIVNELGKTVGGYYDAIVTALHEIIEKGEKTE
jgi:hypothetical protein